MSNDFLSFETVENIEKEQTLVELLKTIDVAEVFSPPRVTAEAEKWGLKAGDAMDLTTGWDFNLERHREAAKEYIRRMKVMV